MKVSIIALPTIHQSHIYQNKKNNKFGFTVGKEGSTMEDQNVYLYFTKKDIIYQLDWYYDPEINDIARRTLSADQYEGCSKIIATTDPKLGLPMLSLEYQKYFTEVIKELKDVSLKFYIEEDTLKEYVPSLGQPTITVAHIKELHNDTYTENEVEELCRTAYRDGYEDREKEDTYSEDTWIKVNLDK